MTHIAPIALTVALSLLVPTSPESFKTLARSKKGYYTASTKVPIYPGITSVTNRANARIRSWAIKSQAQYVTECNQTFKDLGKPTAPYQYIATGKTMYFYAPRLVSTVIDQYSFTGGAHGSSQYFTFNTGIVGGVVKALTLGDCFRKGSEYKALIDQLVIGKLMANPAAEWVQNGQVKSLTAEQMNRFCLEPTGMRFYINQYEAGPYSNGRFEVALTVKDLGPDFNRALILAR